jgi:transposase-like protein
LKCRSDEVRYTTDNVLTAQIVKKNGFLQFEFLGEESELNHLKSVEDNKEDIKSQIKSLNKEGYSQREIAREIGCSPTTVNKYLKNEGHSAKDVTPVTGATSVTGVTPVTGNTKILNKQTNIFE